MGGTVETGHSLCHMDKRADGAQTGQGQDSRNRLAGEDPDRTSLDRGQGPEGGRLVGTGGQEGEICWMPPEENNNK